MFQADVSSGYYFVQNDSPFSSFTDQHLLDFQLDHLVSTPQDAQTVTKVKKRVRNGFTDLCHCASNLRETSEVDNEEFRHPYGKLMP